MKITREQFKKLSLHNLSVSMGDKDGRLIEKDVVDYTIDTLPDFVNQLQILRFGSEIDSKSRKIPLKDVSLAESLCKFYGFAMPDRDIYNMPLSKKQKEMFVIQKFLRNLDVYMSDSLHSVAKVYGDDNLSVASLNKMLLEHSTFQAPMNTTSIDASYRFLIPELILSAIRIDYEAASQHMNWISGITNISQREVTMPHIKRGNSGVRKIGEAESIPFGTVSFGKKKASVYKVGTGFKITDELVDSTPLSLLFQFLGEVGVDMSIGADVEAYTILRNGEQVNGDESAPVIGVNATGTHGFKDLKRGYSRMKRLGKNANRLITGEESGIDISSLTQFEGFNGGTNIANMNTILGVPPILNNDIFVMPSDEIMLLDPTTAMTKLQYRGIRTEERRNPQTQEMEMFVSDHIGFAIVKRDSRLVIDNSVLIGSQGFPAYMDIDARISEAFKTMNDE